MKKIAYSTAKSSSLLALVAGLSILFTGFAAKAETLILVDTSYVINGAPVETTNVSLRFGIWNSLTSTFSQAVIGDNHLGYATMTGDELQLSLNQTDSFIYSGNSLLAVAIFAKNGVADSGPLDYSVSDATFRAILTDSSWKTPVAGFANNTTEVPFFFTANTTAVVGSFTFGSSGSDTIALVPEPGTSSLLLLGGLVLTSLRRNKNRKNS